MLLGETRFGVLIQQHISCIMRCNGLLVITPQQQGSKVDADWLRFDFTNLQPVTETELDQIEQDVISPDFSSVASKLGSFALS